MLTLGFLFDFNYRYESYDSYEGMLHVEIEQARNLGALPLPEKTRV